MASLLGAAPEPPKQGAAGATPSSSPPASPALLLGSFDQIRKSYGTRRIKSSTDDQGIFTGIVYGAKDAGKTKFPLGYPKPKGSRTIILTYDLTTHRSIRESFGNQWMHENKVEVYEMVRPRAGYAGFRTGKPQTAVECWAETMAILEEEQAKGDVGNLVMDHFQHLYQGVGTAMIFAVRRLDMLMGKPEFSDWSIRTRSIQAVEETVRVTPCDGGAAFITGYGAEEEYVQEKDATGKSQVSRKMKWPTWLGSNFELGRDWLFTFQLSRTLVEKDGQPAIPTYWCEVMSSKAKALLPIGHKVDWTDGSISNVLQGSKNLDAIMAAAVQEVAEEKSKTAPEVVMA